MADLATLYQGALLGQARAGAVGTAQQEGQVINDAVRANLLATAVATGKLNPSSLSPSDSASLAGFVGKAPPLQKTGGSGGILGILGDVTGFVSKVASNTARDALTGAEGFITGLPSLGQAAFHSFNDLDNAISSAMGLPTVASPKGPTLTDVGKGILKSTVDDFTHFTPYHPLYPALDIASVFSVGAGSAARAGATLSRLGDEGSALARAGEALSKVPGAKGMGEPRNVGQIYPETDYARAGVQAPTLPIGAYSATSPLRNLIEHGMDSAYGSGLAQVPVDKIIPGLPEGTTLGDLRSSYHLRNIARVDGSISAAAVQKATADATQGFNLALHDLLRESNGREEVASMKFDATVLSRILAADNLTPAEKLERLSEYRERVLTGPAPGVDEPPEAPQIRQVYKNLTSSKEYRTLFANPTDAMKNVGAAMDDAIMKGAQALGLDPREILNNALGPVAHLYNKTPEEMLREQPALVQAQSNFAVMASDVEKAIKESGGGDVSEEALANKMAALLPGTATITDKVKLVKDAIESLKEDIRGEHSRIALSNNAESTGYLQGNTIAQKVALGLYHRLGVDATIAQPFAIGGFTNYFPSASALRMKIRPSEGRIGRMMNRLTGREPGRPVLSEYKRGNPIRLLGAHRVGVAPYADFLKEKNLDWFAAGVERRDPEIFRRHLGQRERVIVHRLVSEPTQDKLALKDAKTGAIKMYGSQAELESDLGVRNAQKYTLVPLRALRVLNEATGAVGKQVADVLKASGGTVSPEVSDHIDQLIDEAGHDLTAQIQDTVVADRDKMPALPTAYVNELINQTRVIDSNNKIGGLWRSFIGRWRQVVLAYMPAWLLRTSVGHGLVLFIHGVMNPADYLQAHTYFSEGFKVPGTDIRLSKGLGREVPMGIDQGMPHQDFGKFVDRSTLTAGFARMNSNAVHSIANFQRRAAFISMLNKVTRARFRELDDVIKKPGALSDSDIDHIIAHRPDLVHDTVNEIYRASYTFGQLAPWERKLAKNIMPFYGWYKFVTKFAWSLPITYPGKAMLLTRIAQMGQSQQDQLGAIPDWLRSALLFDTHNLSQVHYLSLLGLNPLGDVANPTLGIQGIARLGQLSPVIQAAIEGMGYNTLTGSPESIDPTSGIIEENGQYIDLKTGKPYETLGLASPTAALKRSIGGLMREFPQIRLAETWFTHGYSLYPESIPFIAEKPIPLPAGSKPKDVSALSLASQFLGVGPKTYNLQHWQQNLQTDIARATSAYNNAIAKQRAQGILPKVP